MLVNKLQSIPEHAAEEVEPIVPPWDVAAVREEFPILSREVYPGIPLVYLDSAATSLKPARVIDAITEHYRLHSANVHRGIHRLAEEATEFFEQGRERVARFLRAQPQEIIFTRGATESINLVAFAWARPTLRRGDQILISEMEHHSNLIPWQQVSAETGAELQFIPLGPDGQFDLAQLDGLLGDRTRLVAITAASNVLGTVVPIRQVVERAQRAGAVVLVDAAQSVPHMPTDVVDLGCDFLACSGHKMCGPDGIGVLYGREAILEAMPPFMTGGQMIRRVRRSDADWNELPWKFEAGTPPIAPAIGLGAAVEYLSRLDMRRVKRYVASLVRAAYEALRQIPGVRTLGPGPEHRSGLVSFTLEGVHPHDLAQVLDRSGVAIRAGHHCAQPLHAQLGITASARASFYIYNTPGDIDRLIGGIWEAKKLFGG